MKFIVNEMVCDKENGNQMRPPIVCCTKLSAVEYVFYRIERCYMEKKGYKREDQSIGRNEVCDDVVTFRYNGGYIEFQIHALEM